MLVRSYCVKQNHIQSSQYKTRLSVYVHSLTELHQPFAPLHRCTYVQPIWNSVFSFGLAAGRACSVSKSSSSCLKSVVVMHSFTQRCTIGASSSSWTGSTLKTQERLTDPPHFGIQLRIHNVFEELLLPSVQCIAEVARTPATTVSYILTESWA